MKNLRSMTRSFVAPAVALAGLTTALAAALTVAPGSVVAPNTLLAPVLPVAPSTAILPQDDADTSGEITPTLDPAWVDAFDWRSIGPANMGGRIVDLAVYEADPSIFYVATASGGILKTTNKGTTFEHQFDRENTVSIGDIEVDPSNPDIVWVGTGEQNPRNSVSWGDGVYKSIDGGATFTHVGLKDSFQIGKIIVHPEDGDTVLVGALGRLWGENEERGVYRTTDGGETWTKVLHVDDRTGVIDMAMDPDDPDVILACTWERMRDEFDTNDPATRWGPGSGLWRSTDGGETFEKVTKGLPDVDMGRMGLAWSHENPDHVYLLVDSIRIGTGISNPGYLGINGRDAEAGARITRVVEDAPAAEAGIEVDDIVVAVDGARVLSYDDFLGELRIRQAGDEATLEIARGGELIEVDVEFAEHPEPPEKPFTRDLGGQRDGIQDQQGEDGDATGGLYLSKNDGRTWERINSINPRPMYFSKVYVDPSDEDYQWILGIAMHKSEDGGETWTRDGAPGEVHVDHHALWIDPNDGEHMMLGNDGGLYVTWDRGRTWDHLDHAAIAQFYHVAVDDQPLYNVYGGLQDNGSWGGPNRTRTREGTYNTDWFRIGGGDGFICEIDRDDPNQLYYSSQNGGLGRVHLLTGERRGLRPRAPRGTSYRWNWRTPYMLSHHNAKIWYAAGNHVFRSFDRGDDPKRISPEITRTRRGSATAFDESPVDPDLLMVGSDDGALWVTRDGGDEWVNLLFPYDADAYPEEDDEEEPDADGESEGSDDASDDEPTSLPDRMKRLDENGDGRIQRDEFPERLRRMFDALDEDDDGALDAAEATAAMERVRFGRGNRDDRGDATRDDARSDAEADDATDAEEAPDADVADESAAPPVEPTDPDDPVVGTWAASLLGEMAGGPGFTLVFERQEDGSLAVSIDATTIDATTKTVRFDEATGALGFAFDSERGRVTFDAKLVEEKIVGSFELAAMEFTGEFQAVRSAAAEADEEPSGPTIAELVDRPRRVSGIEWSKFARNRVYVTLDGHYQDDDEPHVFASDDAGRTWRSLRANLPTGTTRVIREDLENPDVLYLGTEFALWVSIDRGGSWTRLNGDLPTVAIHEIAQHATSGEIIAGTHGRSIWALDVTPLRTMSAKTIAADAWLYEPNTVVRWRVQGERGRGASRWFAGENPTSSGQIFYSLASDGNDVELTIRDASGKTIRTLDAPGSKGLHRVTWDLRTEARNRPGQRGRGRLVAPGTYRAVLRVGDMEVGRDLTVVRDPDSPAGVTFAEDEFVEELYADEEDGAEDDADENTLH